MADPDLDTTIAREVSASGARHELTLEGMLASLASLTGFDFSSSEASYTAFVRAAETEIQSTEFSYQVAALHQDLSADRVFGNIKALESWANGETAYKTVTKSWASTVDKLYRLNIEENDSPDTPPRLFTVTERAQRKVQPSNDRWITPDRAHEFADDLVRTKFVVPFADSVKKISDELTALAAKNNLQRFRRYHAKDSGYHAHHLYVLLPVPGLSGGDENVTFEIKILTKLQDTLGELTHLLYELKRTGVLTAEKKRKLAWQFESPDFTASYLGHSAHYVESEVVRLKSILAGLNENGGSRGEP